ncbi:hypothetical protein DSO57_1018398 [Entomophthora muscae]|uniref:Uncharacterized protein n=1 Tax=Entomophthora muscae TaxID=34485 RepID=A0ACC2U329_9FUNG|nr:hypothetical protein DSO57_1018398 [Entomophthora muscae]
MKTARYEDKSKKRRRGAVADDPKPSANKATDEILKFTPNLVSEASLKPNDPHDTISLVGISNSDLSDTSAVLPKEKRKKLRANTSSVLSETFLRELNEEPVGALPLNLQLLFQAYKTS